MQDDHDRATQSGSVLILAGRDLQELEAQNKRLIEAQTEVSGRPADFLPRAEHQRILTARMDQASVQHQSELRSKLDQAGRDLKWRLEAQVSEQEATAAAGLHQVC